MSQSPMFDRHFTCPVCSNEFTSMSVRSAAVNVVKIESDRHTIYRGPSPLHYFITVCPACLYAAPYTKFGQPINDDVSKKIIEANNKYKNLPAFNIHRDMGLSLLAFNLSVECAKIKQLPSSEIAGLILSMAWIARESEHKDIEQRCLNQSLEYFITAYTAESEGKLSDVELAYIIGDIYRRTGNDNEAIVWFNLALNSKNIKDFPKVEKQAREAWMTIQK